MRLLILLITFSFPCCLPAQANSTNADDGFVKKSFLIILSTKDYESALEMATESAEALGDSIDLRGMVKDSLDGLTATEPCGCGEMHGYIPRGRYDDGNYISIEYSDYFDGFTEGYYIVVVASGNTEALHERQKLVNTIYADAYVKSTSVYVGCMH